jgi:four helix bundle protein
MTLKIEELEVYQLAMDIGEQVWKMVNQWNHFEKSGIGSQLTNAADSIAANISEGFGRYHFKENKNFCYYSRGSAFETKTFIEKAKNRNLIPSESYDSILKKIDYFLIKHNSYINSIGRPKYIAASSE